MTDSIEGTAGPTIPNDSISVIWHIEDVQSVRPALTAAEAYEVLTLAEQNHDANIGINWDVLREIADILY